MTYEEVFYHKTNNKLEIYYHITFFFSSGARRASGYGIISELSNLN